MSPREVRAWLLGFTPSEKVCYPLGALVGGILAGSSRVAHYAATVFKALL